MGLKLGARLAVLSACDTGRGRLTGEGVVGLSYALIRAGIPSVLVSLWSVPDESTAVLMSHFYQIRLREESLAEALRQAMLATIADGYKNPRQWAAFTLIGQWATN
jgi:CHAT domain-containing protein